MPHGLKKIHKGTDESENNIMVFVMNKNKTFFFLLHSIFFPFQLTYFFQLTKQIAKNFYFFFLVFVFFLSNISMNKIQNIDSKISNIVSLKYYINNFFKKKVDYALFFSM